MGLTRLFAQAQPQAGAPGLHGIDVDSIGWQQALGTVAAGGGRLLSLWAETPGSAARVHALLGADLGLLRLGYWRRLGCFGNERQDRGRPVGPRPGAGARHPLLLRATNQAIGRHWPFGVFLLR